jgi:hypothetical protein
MSSLTLDLLTSKSIGFMYYVGCISVWSLKSVKLRVLKILSGQYIPMSSLTFHLKINSGHVLFMLYRCTKFDWLIIYCFTSRWRISHLYGDVTITVEGLQNLGLCSALRAFFEQGEGSLSCHTCCDTGLRFFRSHPKDRPIQSPLTTRMGMRRIDSNPDPLGEQSLKFVKQRVLKILSGQYIHISSLTFDLKTN